MAIITPKEITQDSDTGVNIASFSYYDGIPYCKEKGIIQDVNFDKVMLGTHFVVCCGEVMVKIQPTDFPDINRRIL